MELRPASEIRAEIAAKKASASGKFFDRSIADITKKIEDNKRQGTISVQSLRADVVEALEAKGYKVDFARAWHCGDVDTHTISWKEEK